MKAAIIINAYSRLEHSLYQSDRIREELLRMGVEADILRNNFFAASVSDSGEIVSKLGDYAFCVYLDKDKYTSLMLERAGMRLFNRHDAIEVCDDKMTTFIRLADSGIPMPRTLAGLLCYDPQEDVSEQTLKEVEDSLGYPMIVKMCYGSLGKGVFKVDNADQLRRAARELKCTPHLFQRFVPESYGRDMRVMVIRGKCVAAMERRSDGDFRSNLELGGSAKAITPPREVAAMCEKAADILRLDYCGVDVLYGKDEYLLCEVNSNAFFRGLEAATGKNIARAYCEHMLSCIK